MKSSSYILKVILLIAFSAFIMCCSTSNQFSDDGLWKGYLTDYHDWQKERLKSLKEPMGYLGMVGLYWLKEGKQTFGAAIENDLVFPTNFPEKLGTLSLESNTIHLELENPQSLTVDNKNVNEALLRSDADGQASMMNMGSFFWYIIKRGDQYGIRMKDTMSENRMNLNTIHSYAPLQKWLITGTYHPVERDSSISITNKVGITYDSKLMGTLIFKVEGGEHKLLATDGGEGKLFIVFADQTNGTETYGGGRFLYVDIPAKDQPAILDFNKAENPICAFSDFATCPLPRKENYLPFAVRAGEKKVR